ncbi:hypothetical protein [Larkinella soli]|uniref:hypothetical protein n=1 Tax=Larkinella soli TaxID=1770527 RepID=UPI000FFB692A|nr:hypothetical protein [Larkinella soli]
MRQVRIFSDGIERSAEDLTNTFLRQNGEDIAQVEIVLKVSVTGNNSLIRTVMITYSTVEYSIL